MKPTYALIAVLSLVGAGGAIAFAQTNSAPAPAAPNADAQQQTDENATQSDQTTSPAALAPQNQNPTAAEPAPNNPQANGATAPGQKPAAVANIPPQPAIPVGPPPTPPNAVLEMTGLDKITGRPTRIVAHLNQPVEFATLTITARYCYSTPPSETPETSAFLQIDDHRPDQAERRVFSGWMYASSPGLNAMQHPLYDVWVISCSANVPGQTRATVASSGPVKVRSPDSTDTEKLTELPEGAGQ